MAIGKKTGGRDFKKGESGNPAGRPKMTDWERYVKHEGKQELFQFVSEIGAASTNQLKLLLADGDTSQKKKLLIRLYLEAAKPGAIDYFELYLKLHGININKLEIDNTSSDGSFRPVNLKDVPFEQLVKLYEAGNED